MTQSDIILHKDHTMLHDFVSQQSNNYKGVELYLTRKNLWTTLFNARKDESLPYINKNALIFELIDIMNTASAPELTMDELMQA